MKKIIFALLAFCFVSCSSDERINDVCSELYYFDNSLFSGYQIVVIDSVEYIAVFNSYGISGICPKISK